jgi:hypothetical protein
VGESLIDILVILIITSDDERASFPVFRNRIGGPDRNSNVYTVSGGYLASEVAITGANQISIRILSVEIECMGIIQLRFFEFEKNAFRVLIEYLEDIIKVVR